MDRDIMFDVFLGQPNANSTDYKSVFDEMEANVKLLDTSVSGMEVSVRGLERSEKRSNIFMGIFAVTILALCCSLGYNFYLTAGLKADIQILSQVKFGPYEEQTKLQGTLSVKSGLTIEPDSTLPAPPVQRMPGVTPSSPAPSPAPPTLPPTPGVTTSSPAPLPTSNFRKRFYRPSKM